MKRLVDWPTRLAEYIAARRDIPFGWGSNDCCTFACGAVAAQTGSEPFPELRGHRSAFAATRVLVRHGCRDACDIATLVLGPPLSSPKLAGRGDVVGCDFGNGFSLGICLGASAAFVEKKGLGFVPRGVLKRAWRV